MQSILAAITVIIFSSPVLGWFATTTASTPKAELQARTPVKMIEAVFPGKE